MQTTKKSLVLIIVMIIMIYMFGLIQGFIYEITLDNNTTFQLTKHNFFDLEDASYDINNRALTQDEPKLRTYQFQFSSSEFSNLLVESKDLKPTWYILIERPDCQYFQVKLNNTIIGTHGSLDGRANLWTSTFFIPVNEIIIEDLNTLQITMYSDYMTGVAGDIRLLSHDQYRKMSNLVHISENTVLSSMVIAFFAAFLIGLILLAWQKELYNYDAYIFFMIAIISAGLVTLDYQNIGIIPFDYHLFKKIIILSNHMTITFTGMAVARLLNSKWRYNIGLIGVIAVFISWFVFDTVIGFRLSYIFLNVFIVIGLIQMLLTLFRNRKQSPISATVMLLGFSLSGITIVKLLVIITFNLDVHLTYDLPILILIFAIIILYTIYAELIQKISVRLYTDQDYNQGGITDYMQGNFTINHHMLVTEGYSTSCNHIFKQFILGKNMVDLFQLDKEQSSLLRDTLEAIFSKAYGYKEGFLELLPTEITIYSRTYHLKYELNGSHPSQLDCYLSDVTMVKMLQLELKKEESKFNFIVNVLKSPKEMSYLISKIKKLIKKVEQQGIYENISHELHTIKGNLGQYGFSDYEAVIHVIEDELLSNNTFSAEELVMMLEEGLEHAFNLLKEFVGEHYFDTKEEDLLIQKHQLIQLEQSFLALADTTEEALEFYTDLKNLRKVSLIEMLMPYNLYLEKLSSRLDKLVAPLNFEGMDFLVYPERIRGLTDVLVVVFRNAMVHGIENPEDRFEKGKDPYGQIQCRIEVIDKSLYIGIRDDGQGIDYPGLFRKAIDLGLLTEGADYEEPALMTLIFEEQLSTYDEADIYAGRGLGVSAVLKQVQLLGGSMNMKSELDQYTLMEMIIPIINLDH